MDKFFEAAGWSPRRLKPVAFSTDTSRDYEYTDWVGLDGFVDELAGKLSSSTPRAGK